MRGKRGRYLSYLQNGPKAKIPRQTEWNRRNRQNQQSRRMQNDVDQEQQQAESVSTNNINMSTSIITADDSCIQNDTMNLIDQTITFDAATASSEFDEINISVVGNDSELDMSQNDEISIDFNETEIIEDYEENEHEFSVDYFRKIHNNLECTKADVLSMIYAYSVRHSLNWTAIEDLILLVNSIVGKDALPPSKYMFMKMFKPKERFQSNVHLWCQVCEKYFGVKENSVNPVCRNCNSGIITDTKYNKNHFVSMQVKSQLRHILEQNEDHLIIGKNVCSDNICDVHDSHNFQQLKSKMGNVPYITLTLYTDGAAVFKSTKDKSLWPICALINEINLTNRFKRKNILCTAISFGKTPNMQMFFKPLIEEINAINDEGGMQFRNKNGVFETVKVIPMLFTADALAKAYVLNIMQHNGHYGCPYCLHCGTNIEGTTQIRYCNEHCAANRTNQRSRNDMISAHETAETVNGYKGLSPLMALGQNFDVNWQVVIDKMHNVDMGVARKLFDLFLNPKNGSEE